MENETISICLGTKKLFLKQFNLEENDYQCHEKWKEQWHKKRHNRIFYIGSKDESYGNQNCQLIDGSLKIRVIPELESIYGKQYIIPNISFQRVFQFFKDRFVDLTACF
ncbi:MAG: hypothetical protein HQK76_13390 [Desulfobacterales bacterium]|nr:hypothetical protein [Desulfobacterales bacterium]